jgi:hypothetical protein
MTSSPASGTNFRITVSERVMRDLVNFADRFCRTGDIASLSYGTWFIKGINIGSRFSIGAGPRREPRILDGRGQTPPLITIIDGVEVKLSGCGDFAALGHIHLDYVGKVILNVA